MPTYYLLFTTYYFLFTYPIFGKVTDGVVAWRGQSNISEFLDGALALEFDIADDATVFAYRL